MSNRIVEGILVLPESELLTLRCCSSHISNLGYAPERLFTGHCIVRCV